MLHITTMKQVMIIATILTLSACGGNDSLMPVEQDTRPDAFSFTPQTDVVLNTAVTSDTVIITGINEPTDISIINGSYAIDGGSFGSAASTIEDGQSVVLQVLAADTPATTTVARLSVGGIVADFSVSTEAADDGGAPAADITPNVFTFAPGLDVAIDTLVESNVITVSGINAPAPISVVGGEYRIDGGAFRSDASTVDDGQSVALRLRAAEAPASTTQAILTIGDVSADFALTTAAEDGGGASGEPDVLIFNPGPDVAINTVVEFEAFTVTGIEDSASISIVGGEYSIDGGTFRSDTTTVSRGQSVVLRLGAAATPATSTQATLTIAGIITSFEVTTEAIDSTPNPLTFSPLFGLAPGATALSNAVIVSGINAPVPISVVGGEYRIDGGAFRSDAATVASGQRVELRLNAANTPATPSLATLSIGGVSASFTVITEALDSTPDTLAFIPQLDIALGETVLSNAIAVTGINAPVPISVVGGEYRIDGGAFRSDAATVASGQRVELRLNAADTPATPSLATLSIGGVSASFTVITEALDSTPDTLAFIPQLDIALGSTVLSNAITVTDINAPVSISVVGGEYRIDGGAFRSDAATVASGQRVELRLNAADTPATPSLATLSIGGVSASFTVITEALDSTPDTLAFIPQLDIALGATVLSNAITVADINAPVPISVVGGEYRIDGGAFRSDGATVESGQRVELRLNAAATSATSTRATLVVGGVSASFTVTTKVIDVTPDDFSFTTQTNVPFGRYTVSNTVTLSGFEGAIELTVSGGEYSINNQAYSTENTLVTSGSSLTLRHLTPAAYSTPTATLLTVGEISRIFMTTTPSTNTYPQWLQVEQAPAEALITSSAGISYSSYAADIDDDGDMDVVSAAYDDNTIVWYENDGAAEPNFIEHQVAANVEGAFSVVAADVDGDGDLDVLSASLNDNTIAWYENDGGESGPSFVKHVISAAADFARSVFVADVDDDGDLDVLSAWDNTIAWYENDGIADPSFTEHVITNDVLVAAHVFAADVDGDGDLDMLSASASDDTIAWYESDGAVDPSFTKHVITTEANYATSVFAADVDGDGDMDVLSASSYGGNAWYENDGTADPSFIKHVITTSWSYAWSISAADMDGDGDMDVLASSFSDQSFAWYENDGAVVPGFVEHVVTKTSGIAVFADVDGDGDMDMVSDSYSSRSIVWYSLQHRRHSALADIELSFDESASDADGDTLVYSIDEDASHPLDASYFDIDSATGIVTFSSAPSAANPGDGNGDNVYAVWITVTDGYATLRRKIEVEVSG